MMCLGCRTTVAEFWWWCPECGGTVEREREWMGHRGGYSEYSVEWVVPMSSLTGRDATPTPDTPYAAN
jgi:hypothetical protein